MQPAPTIDEQTGEPCFNVRQAAHIIGIGEETLRTWAKHGSTPFGFELDVRTTPVTHHRRSTQTPRTFRETRMLIPQARVMALKEILDADPIGYGPIPRDHMEALKAAARRFPLPLSHARHSPSLG